MRVGTTIVVGVIGAAGIVWFEYLEPITCAASNRIVSPEQAVAFAKERIREDKNFWPSIGVSDSDEVERLLAERCCSAFKGDYFIQDSTRWGTFMSAESKGRYDFQYEVFFSECGKHVRPEKLATRF